MNGDQVCDVLNSVCSGGTDSSGPLEIVLSEKAWPPSEPPPPGEASQRGLTAATLSHLSCSESHIFEEMVTHFITCIRGANLAN